MNLKEQRLDALFVRGLLVLGLTAGGVGLFACSGDDDGGDDVDGGTDENDAGAGSGGTSGSGGTGGAGAGGSGAGGAGGSGGAGGTGDPGDDGGVDEDAGAAPIDAGETATLRDVTLDLTDFDPHVDQLMHFRVVSDDDELVALGVFDPLQDGDADMALPGSTPSGLHRMDFFADFNGNRMYDPPPADHAWRLQIGASGDADLEYTHDTVFTNVATPTLTQGEDFTLSATDMEPHVGQLFELRVFEQDTNRLCGRYVLGEITAAEFELTLPGIVETGKVYRVDFYADVDGNGTYDPPPTDHAWRATQQVATAAGLTIDFAPTTFTDVGF